MSSVSGDIIIKMHRSRAPGHLQSTTEAQDKVAKNISCVIEIILSQAIITPTLWSLIVVDNNRQHKPTYSDQVFFFLSSLIANFTCRY